MHYVLTVVLIEKHLSTEYLSSFVFLNFTHLLFLQLPEDFAFGLYDLDWEIFEQHYKAAANRLPDIEKVGIRSSVCGPGKKIS